MAAVKTRNTATLMTEGSIVKSLLLFALPLIFGNLLQQMYNTADSIIVGNFVGSNALAAVGSSGSPIYLLIGFSQGLAEVRGWWSRSIWVRATTRRPARRCTPPLPLQWSWDFC